MNLFVGALSMGLLLSLLALGVFTSWRVLKVFDLTVDGSFGLGAAVGAVALLGGAGPGMAMFAGAVAGALAGAASGMLHTRLKVPALLAGMLVTTALYSVDLYVMRGGDVALAGTAALPTTAERYWTAVGAPEAGLEIGGAPLMARNAATFVMLLPLAGGLAAALILFFRTALGHALRATGDNASMARALAIDTDGMFTVGLVVANALVGASGSLFAQYQGFANIQMSVGMLVTGLASVTLGEALLGRSGIGRRLVGVILGSILFRLLVAAALQAGLDANALKLVTAAFVLAALVLPGAVRRLLVRAEAKAHG